MSPVSPLARVEQGGLNNGALIHQALQTPPDLPLSGEASTRRRLCSENPDSGFRRNDGKNVFRCARCVVVVNAISFHLVVPQRRHRVRGQQSVEHLRREQFAGEYDFADGALIPLRFLGHVGGEFVAERGD